jgi:hypothetical protein
LCLEEEFRRCRLNHGQTRTSTQAGQIFF